MLPKNYRLKKRTEFQYSYKHGDLKRYHEFGILIFKRRDKLLRIGFSVSKKVGKAVTRNLVKRRLRDIVRKNVNNINRGYNLIFVAYPNIVTLNYQSLSDKIYKALLSLNLIEVKDDNI